MALIAKGQKEREKNEELGGAEKRNEERKEMLVRGQKKREENEESGKRRKEIKKEGKK